MLDEVLNCEHRWIYNEGIEKTLFYASQGKEFQVALFGAGTEIKHLELEGKYLSIEVCHPDAQSLDDRELLLMFENCVGRIAGFHKYLVAGQGEVIGKWGTITLFSLEVAKTEVNQLSNAEIGGSLCPSSLRMFLLSWTIKDLDFQLSKQCLDGLGDRVRD